MQAKFDASFLKEKTGSKNMKTKKYRGQVDLKEKVGNL
jgi:hypothetical protein